jgi:hypothetical protein
MYVVMYIYVSLFPELFDESLFSVTFVVCADAVKTKTFMFTSGI